MEKILIVDDDRTMAQALSLRLRHAGWNVLTCHNAYNASEVAVHERPDIIVLDIDMPYYTGFELHECLQFAQRARSIPVIYLSGHDTETNRRIASERGAEAFTAKPYDPADLIATIRSVLNHCRSTTAGEGT